MRSLLFIAIVLAAQFTFAQRRMTMAEARTRVEASPTYRAVETARREGRDITRDAALMNRVNRMLDTTLRDVVRLSEGDKAKLGKLINTNAIEVLAEVARLSSIVKDTSTSAAEKQSAQKTLRLIIMASHSVNSLVVNSAQARVEQQLVVKIIEVSRKAASLNFGTASADFVQRYEQALTNGKHIDEAIRIASNGRFTERDLRECT